MTRIQLTDSTMDMVLKMAEGNPGAITAIMDLMSNNAEIDPQDFLGGLGPILSLDTHGIYGSSIYVLWNDKCDRDVRKMLVLLRSVQLGFLPESKLQELAADQCRQVNLTDEEINNLDKKVCDQLKDFQKAA